MKKTILLVSLISVSFSLLVSGCEKKVVPQETPVQEDEPVEVPEHIDLIEEKLLPSVVLAPNAGLNILGRDNKMHRMNGLSRGSVFETVQINGAIRNLNLYDEEENPETYIHGVHDNVDFWIFENYVAKNSVPGIMIEEFEGLKFGQIVGVSLDSGETEETLEKVLVYYFDRKQDKVCEKEIDAWKVSTYKDDVEMAAIVEKLRTTTRATPRNELFLKAEKLKASPAMKKILDAEKTEKLSYDYQEVLKTMPGARYIVNVEELNTVDQSKDPFKN